MEQAYVYKWTHIPTMMWYVGSRTSKNAHPNDGYICSSKYVNPMIKSNPSDWTREIIEVGTAQAMKDLEAEILQLFDAAGDPRSFNKNNAKPNGGWNAGITGEQHHRYGKKLSYKKPYTVSEKFLTRQRDLNAVNNKIRATCPHCNKEGQMIAMKRWHFEKCKFKGEL